MKKFIVLLLAALLAMIPLALTGCSGSSDSSEANKELNPLHLDRIHTSERP